MKFTKDDILWYIDDARWKFAGTNITAAAAIDIIYAAVEQSDDVLYQQGYDKAKRGHDQITGEENRMTNEEAIKILSQCGWDGLPHGYTGGYREAIDMAIEALKQTQFIPCEERLPKRDESVFVYLFKDSPYIAWYDGFYWCTDDFTVDKDEEPLAWMPLPKPYERGSNNV